MRLAHTLRRWTVRGIRSLLFAAALGVPAAAALGQAAGPRTEPAAKKTYTKNQAFDLPIQMDDATRAGLKEVRLYVKIGAAPWALHEAGQPALTRFTYRVPHDGEYWFTLATVDRAGKSAPADVTAEAPSLRVVVDSQPPTLTVQAWTSPEGELCLRCAMQDMHPDPASFKAVCKAPAGDAALEPVAGQPGTFRVRGTEMMTHPVRVSATDLAGNAVNRDVNVKELVGAALTGASPAQAAGGATIVAARPDLRPALPASSRTDTPKVELSAEAGAKVTSPDLGQTVTVPAQGPVITSGPALTEPHPERRPGPPVPRPVPPEPQAAAAETRPAPEPTARTVTAGQGGRQLINTTRASMEYRIDEVGPSGVGKVEMYLTPDAGQTWMRVREDTDRRSPAEIDLPGEGQYGVRLVITNGNGFGGTPPARGDTPHCLLEVDTTSPYVQLRPVEVLPQAGVLEVRWTGTDKNLSGDPVALFYRTRPDGAWQLIARNVKNDGAYRWTFPRDVGSNFFFKVEVTDQAGNVGNAEMPTPVVLDMAEPRVTVVGVTGMGGRATAPSGN